MGCHPARIWQSIDQQDIILPHCGIAVEELLESQKYREKLQIQPVPTDGQEVNLGVNNGIDTVGRLKWPCGSSGAYR